MVLGTNVGLPPKTSFGTGLGCGNDRPCEKLSFRSELSGATFPGATFPGTTTFPLGCAAPWLGNAAEGGGLFSGGAANEGCVGTGAESAGGVNVCGPPMSPGNENPFDCIATCRTLGSYVRDWLVDEVFDR